VLRVFGPAIREVRPDVEKAMRRFRQHKLEEANVAVRYTEDLKTDLRVDCQVRFPTISRVYNQSRRGRRSACVGHPLS
jgi:hypothetical protein